MHDRDRTRIVEMVGLTTIAALLRFYHLGFQSFWCDESLSVSDVARPFSQIHRHIMASPPLYHYLLRCFYLMFGRDDFWLRFPSAVIGVVTIPLAYLVIEKFFNKKAAFLTAFLWAFFAFHVYYSQEARMYSLVALEALGSVYFWNMAQESRSWRHWLGYFVVSVIGLYTHNWFVFLVGSQAAYSFFSGIRHKPYDFKGAGIFLLIFLSYLPWVPLLEYQTIKVNLEFNRSPMGTYVSTFLDSFSGLKMGAPTHIYIPTWQKTIAWPLAAGLVVMGLVCSPFKDRTRRIFIANLILPLAMGGAVTYALKPVFNVRYAIIVLPAYFLTMAPSFNCKSVFFRYSAAASVFILVLLSMRPILIYYSKPQKGPWRDVGHFVASNLDQQSIFFAGQLSSVQESALRYYLPKVSFYRSIPSDNKVQRVLAALPLNKTNPMIAALAFRWTVHTSYPWPGLNVLVFTRKEGTQYRK